MELRQHATSSPSKRKSFIEKKIDEQESESSTFITKGAENPTIECDNCSKEIAKQSF